MNALMLLTAIAAGQPPGGSSLPPDRLPTTAPMQLPAGVPPVAWTGSGDWKDNGKRETDKTALLEGRLPAVQPPPGGTEPGGPSPLNFDVTVPPGPPAPAPVAPPAAPAPPTRYALMRALQGTWYGSALDDNRISLYGWTEFSYTAGTARRSNFPVTFNDRANEFSMNQNYLHLERTIDTAKSEYQWGFVTDTILPGTDYRLTLSRGLFDHQLTQKNGGPNTYGFDPYQFYAQAFLPDLGPRGTKVIVGRFATPIGYELIQSADTPFISRAYLFQNNPFTHTGIMSFSQLTDAWSVGNGLVTGADTFFSPANPTYLGQLKWAPPTGRTSVTLNTMLSDHIYDARAAFTFFNVYEMLLTHKLSDRLTYILDTIYSHTRAVPGTGDTDWYGAANYLTYQFAPPVSGTVRAEVFNDATGLRTGSRGFYTEVTVGGTWKPVPSLLIRPSVRYDHNNTSRPFEGKPDLFTAALDVIVRW